MYHHVMEAKCRANSPFHIEYELFLALLVGTTVSAQLQDNTVTLMAWRASVMFVIRRHHSLFPDANKQYHDLKDHGQKGDTAQRNVYLGQLIQVVFQEENLLLLSRRTALFLHLLTSCRLL